MHRRHLIAGLGAMLASPALIRSASAAPLAELVLHGPPAGPSITLAHVAATGAMRHIADKVSFRAWRNPDEMRAGVTSETMGLVVAPIIAAANMYNRGLGVRLVNVMTNGLLHIVSADATLTTLPALRGKRVALPFRNDSPEHVFNRLIKHHGMEKDRDLMLDTTGTPIEAIQLLLAGRIDAALVPEPAASAAIVRGMAAGKTIHRTLDVQAAWGQINGGDATLPQAGLAVTKAFAEKHADILAPVQAVLEKAVAEVNAAPARAAGNAAAGLELPFPVIERSIAFSNLCAIPARIARKSVESLFNLTAEMDAALIGGKLPDEGFYWL